MTLAISAKAATLADTTLRAAALARLKAAAVAVVGLSKASNSAIASANSFLKAVRWFSAVR